MVLLLKRSLFGSLVIVFVLCTVFLAVPAQAQLRKMKVGDKMPEFSLPILNIPCDPNDPNGPKDPNDSNEPNKAVFTYKYGGERVLGVVFLSANQKQSKRAVADIKTITDDLNKKESLFDFVGVISEPSGKEFSKSRKEKLTSSFPVLLDEEYKLWGKLGIIVRPTVLVVGKDDRILWVKAGYVYYF